MAQLVGKDVMAQVGQRVMMTSQFKNKGMGTITQVHADGGYCSVRWDDGNEDGALFTGQKGDFTLVLVVNGGDGPAMPMTGDSSAALADSMASSAHLHKQLLAQEVVKLRKEVAQLKASQGGDQGGGGSETLKAARMEVARLEAQRNEVMAQANGQKAALAKEVMSLRSQLERVDMERAALGGSPGGMGPGGVPGQPGRGSVGQIPPGHVTSLPGIPGGVRDVSEALQRRREFEENFTRTLRELRKELEHTSLKHLSSKGQVPLGVRSLLQLSNERIEKVMEEAAQVPVEERLHIEALRLLMENAKLRKTLNEYSEGLLHNALVKSDEAPGAVRGPGTAAKKPASSSFFGLI
mmetsp:Transcript_10032/g.23330  ORF Transcript_10032/g.23330 Transcript_10032/m.23330 type:complete len:352 (-) Transcript_10032:233-1288(-)|eukprot:CAMPEP_0177750472 /NCGR_PEP_ID=MMETSP0484_2-20121128/33041_1 /TAXON_ID=354590 /ORGANISM="Rhodomonas lens, Strain RHODO" /LENGTH=351 /DNA_ID=CAMNT_0019265531 /DNA_START=102 /DNA_END=1157 /DNA_ORIENTATION=+